MSRGHKDFRDLLRRAKTEGFKISRRRNGHIRILSPRGKIYFCASTPSDWRAIANVRAWLKRQGFEATA